MAISIDSVDQTDLLRGLLALQVAEREERLGHVAEPRRTEVVLADAGLTLTSIASLVGKKPDAVRKAVERARRSKSRAATSG